MSVVTLFGAGAGGGGIPPLSGAVAYRSTNISVSGPTTVGMNAELYDTSGFHDLAVDTSRLTVPSGVSLVRLHAVAAFSGSSSAFFDIIKNGARYPGYAQVPTFSSGSAKAHCMTTGFVDAVAGDYFETRSASGFFTWQQDRALLAIEVIAADVKTSMVQKSAGQAISANTLTTASWDTEVRDSDAFHDPGNPSRLTVPGGISLVRLSCNLAFDGMANGSNLSDCRLLKNGTEVLGGFRKRTYVPSTAHRTNGASAVLAVSEGDYFEVQGSISVAGNIASHEGSWFQIEEVLPASSYCLVGLANPQSCPSGVSYSLAFDREDADTDGAHDLVTNNSRVTVPSGKSRARVSFNIHGPAGATTKVGRVSKNGTLFVGSPEDWLLGSSGDGYLNGMSPWVDVVPGDYFELTYFHSGGAASYDLAASSENWLCVEFA